MQRRKIYLIFIFVVVIAAIVCHQKTFADGVLVPLENIKKGEILHYDMFKYSVKNVGNLSRYLSDWDEQIGEKNVHSVRNLAKNQPVRLSDIKGNAVVKKGDIVPCVFIKYNMKIEAQCLALGSGATDDIVRAKVVETGKVVGGKVAENGTIRVG